ncbi:stomatin-like protein 1 isoform 1-T1 [Discoglossus pictus]
MYKYTALPVGLDEHHPAQITKPAPSDSWLLWGCHTAFACMSFLLLLITFPLSAWCFLKIIPDYQRVVVFRLGRVRPTRGPGLIMLLPFIDQWQRVDMRRKAFNVPPCKVKSRDGALVSMGADVQYRVSDPVLSVMSVQDLNFVTRNTAQNLLTESLGRKYLREIHGDRVRIGEQLQEDINEQVKPWGVNVERVELALEAVLRAPEDPLLGPLNLQGTPSTSGFEQLLVQFVSLVNQSSSHHNTIAPAAVSTDITLQQLLSRLEGSLSDSLVSEVNASYQLYVIMQSGQRAAYYLDLATGSGRCGWGTLPSPPDVTLEISESDLLSMFRGDLHPITAYSGGRLQVTGDLQTALRLEKALQVVRQ